MSVIIFTIFTNLMWLVSMAQGSGLGEQLQVTQRTQMLLLALAVGLILIKLKSCKIKPASILLGGGLCVLFLLIPFALYGATTGIGYLYVFLLLFVLSQVKLTEKHIRLTALSYGVLGITFLLFYNYTPILSGWNTNSVAMLGFFSYAMFYVGFMNVKLRRAKVAVLVVALFYMYLLEVTDSRSGLLFVALSVFFILNLFKSSKLYQNGKISAFLLLLPLMIAGTVVLISQSPMYAQLNNWSMKTFDKPIFNGRENLWEYGFRTLWDSPLFGSGEINNGWHNSAITCLTAFGILGYLLWIVVFKRLLDKSKPYLSDVYVSEAITAFFLIYLQQSVELGLISTAPSFIPYVILGVILGRIRYLNSTDVVKTTNRLGGNDAYCNSHV